MVTAAALRPTAFTPFAPLGAPTGGAPPAASAWVSPWSQGDAFGGGRAAAGDPAMAMAALRVILDQALLALLVAYFEQLGGPRSQDAGTLGGAPGGGALRPTSW